MKYWQPKEGPRVLLSDMSFEHLTNCRNLFRIRINIEQRKLRDFDSVHKLWPDEYGKRERQNLRNSIYLSLEKYKAFGKELQKRVEYPQEYTEEEVYW